MKNDAHDNLARTTLLVQGFHPFVGKPMLEVVFYITYTLDSHESFHIYFPVLVSFNYYSDH